MAGREEDLYSPPCSSPRFPYGKSCPNYRAVSAFSAPLDRGNEAQGGLIRIWLLGNGPEKTLSNPLLSFLSFYSSAAFTSPLLLLFAPRLSQLRSQSLPLLRGDTYVFSGRTDFRPGACTEEKGDDWSRKFTQNCVKNNTQRREAIQELKYWNSLFYCIC